MSVIGHNHLDLVRSNTESEHEKYQGPPVETVRTRSRNRIYTQLDLYDDYPSALRAMIGNHVGYQ